MTTTLFDNYNNNLNKHVVRRKSPLSILIIFALTCLSLETIHSSWMKQGGGELSTTTTATSTSTTTSNNNNNNNNNGSIRRTSITEEEQNTNYHHGYHHIHEGEDEDDMIIGIGNYFADAASIAYEKATATNDGGVSIATAADDSSAVTNNNDNKKFDLDTWLQTKYKTNGGLVNEDRVLLAGIYASAKSVFEFGLGESTYIANHVGVQRYSGVDSDPHWVSKARELSQNPNFRFYFADIGPIQLWGYPVRGDLPKNVYNYQIMPLRSEPQPFDVYMVDGRYRVACLLMSFLHASSRGGDPSRTKVLLHDCVQNSITTHPYLPARNRPYYRQVDHLLNLVEHSHKYLCVYQRKNTTTDQQLFDMWLRTKDNVT